MNNEQVIFNKLKELDIEYKVVKHPKALTMELADKYIAGYSGIRTKTLFICDKKARNFYLIILDENKKLNLKVLGEVLDVKSLRFCSEDKIKEKLNLVVGMVSPFGLVNNEDKDINFIIDKNIVDETITCYPNSCESTVFIMGHDLIKFVTNEGNSVLHLDL